jgi:putative transposase
LFEPTAEQMRQDHEQQVNELYAEIGRLTTQLTWLKKKSGYQLEPH